MKPEALPSEKAKSKGIIVVDKTKSQPIKLGLTFFFHFPRSQKKLISVSVCYESLDNSEQWEFKLLSRCRKSIWQLHNEQPRTLGLSNALSQVFTNRQGNTWITSHLIYPQLSYTPTGPAQGSLGHTAFVSGDPHAASLSL